MPDLKKSMILLIVCICFFMTVSCAFAADSNQDTGCVLADVQDCEMNVEADSAESGDEVSLGVQLASEMNVDETSSMENITGNTVEVFSESTVPETINDLRDELENLKDGDVYNIQKDYVFDRECDSDLLKNRAIHITGDNIVINGNGHTINGNGIDGFFGLFKIIGNNVTLINLCITNFRSYNYDYSNSYWNRYGNDYTHLIATVEWYGDNGVIENCEFVDNVGEDGGALYFNGNNGTIDNCYFDYNAANRGGSIFISGYDNTISNTVLEDSLSMTYDSIFFENPDENSDAMTLTLKNCSFPNELNVNGQTFIKDYLVQGPAIIVKDNKVVYPVVPADSYNELREVIKNLKDGDVYNLTKDYYFDWECNFYPIYANNVTINGNGHKIYGSDLLRNSLIWVIGDNVTINNLIIDIDNADEIAYSASFVDWKGNNGALVNCSFIGNYAKYGGAVSWFGDNGLIDGCLFVNNTAYLAAASIYIGGCNNTIRNSMFLNCYSDLLGDAIFIDYRRKNLTIENILFTNQSEPIFDEGVVNVNIDLDQFDQIVHRRNVAGDYMDISPLLFVSIMKGGINYWNDEISFYGNYYNESGDFVLTITSQKFADKGIEFSQSHYFTNIFNNDFDTVFTKLWNCDYESRFTVTKTVYVSSEADYKDVLKNVFKADKVLDDPTWFALHCDMDYITTLSEKNPLTYVLNLVFTQAITVDCDSTWNLKSSIYSVLNVQGAGSTIRGSFKDRDEDKWVCLSENNALGVSNITIEGFNTAIENMGGQCLFMFVNFNDNEMDYWIDRDWGAAILNTGIITCINCTFTKNSAKNGGAIFNQGLLTLQDCIFSGNDAYGEGDDVCVGDGGQIVVNGVEITENGQSSIVHFADSMSLATSTLIASLCIGASFIIGTAVGFLTANPIAGAIAGAAVGAALGGACAAWIISENFDINFDRMKTILILVGGSAMAGALGGALGGYLGSLYAEGAEWVAANGGPGEAAFDIPDVWSELFRYESISVVTLGGIGGVTYYFTN